MREVIFVPVIVAGPVVESAVGRGVAAIGLAQMPLRTPAFLVSAMQKLRTKRGFSRALTLPIMTARSPGEACFRRSGRSA